MGQSGPIFVYLNYFQTHIVQKNCGLNGIQTRIVGVEGKHADHLTTTMAIESSFYWFFATMFNFSLKRIFCKFQQFSNLIKKFGQKIVIWRRAFLLQFFVSFRRKKVNLNFRFFSRSGLQGREKSLTYSQRIDCPTGKLKIILRKRDSQRKKEIKRS